MVTEYSKRRVLVVDDEPVTAEILSREIRVPLGCEVVVEHDGDALLERLLEENFDVVVTDMHMPGVHGLELVERIRQQFPEVDILVTTGYVDRFPYVEVVKRGACDFLAKPHQPEEMHAKVVRIFEERALRESRELAEQKYRSLFEYSMDGMLVLSPVEHVIRDVNHAFCRTSGREQNELLGEPIVGLFEVPDSERLRQGLAIVVEAGRATLGDLIMKHTSGQTLHLDLSMNVIRVNPEDMLQVVCKDVTEQREMQHRLAEIAQRDSLTGLLNKHTFQRRIEAALIRAKERGTPATLLFLDLDNFKRCNDTYGHQAGDDLLASVGDIIRRHTRSHLDDAFRYGGDEFAVLLGQADLECGVKVAERIRDEFAGEQRYETSVSIGVCEFRDSMNAATMIRAADQALYKAKNGGKNRVCCADGTE